MDIWEQLAELLKKEGKKKVVREKKSKHMRGSFRATKAYADDRQKADKNKRKLGMRKRK